jgi:uncharacterized membrane protein
MLIVHFLGLAMGLGSSFAFMFLGMARSKMEKEEGKKFALNTFAMSSMGHIGLTLLIISGFYLITPFWSALAAMPMLIAKLALVFTLTLTVIILSVYSRRAKKGDTEAHLKKIENLGKVSLLSGIAIVVLAVLIFR